MIVQWQALPLPRHNSGTKVHRCSRMTWLDYLRRRIFSIGDSVKETDSKQVASAHDARLERTQQIVATQEALPVPSRDKYFDAMIQCKPCDRDKANRAITALYECIGEPAPSIVWAASPFAAARAASLLAWTVATRFANDAPILVRVHECESRLRNVDCVLLSTRMHPISARRDWVPFSASATMASLIFQNIGKQMDVEGDDRTTGADAWLWAWQYLMSCDMSEDLRQSVESAALLLWTLSDDEQRQIVNRVNADISQSSNSRSWRQNVAYHYAHNATWILRSLDETVVDGIDRLTAEERLRLTCAAQSVFECGYWWPLKGIAVVSDRPTAVHLNASNELHRTGGPAISWPDGYSIYAVSGIEVPEYLAMRQFAAADIDKEPNLETRRLMIDAYGAEPYLRESGAQVVHFDRFGTLYRKSVKGDEAIVMVEVVNSTPETDGSFKKYFIRVPPDMRTTREAVAWTFGLDANEYGPAKET